MTYKNISFSDSPTMRSLERLAKETGLIKREMPAKKASAPIEDLSISANLTENIMRLCAGLNRKGLTSFADEIENSFVQYKQAQTLYGTSKETGDDLVESAHPKGSHKLEGVDSSEAVFEDILDRHLKMVKIVNKTPTGKLSTAKGIIGAVRLVFAQDAQSAAKDQLEAQVSAHVSKVIDALRSITSHTAGELTLDSSEIEDRAINMLSSTTIDNLNGAKNLIGKLKNRFHPPAWEVALNPAFSFMGTSRETAKRVDPLIATATDEINAAIDARNKLNDLVGQGYVADLNKPTGTPTTSAPSAPATPGDRPMSEGASTLIAKFNEAKKQLGLSKDRADLLDDKALSKKIIGWIDGSAIPWIDATVNKFSKSGVRDELATIQGFQDKYDQFAQKLTALKQKYNV